MKIFHGYKNITGLRSPVIAVGIFDGIHAGHRRVIKAMLRAAGRGRDRAVMTFDPHPRSVLYPTVPLPRIMSLEHRLSILRKMGVNVAIVVNFSDHTASMSPEDFVKEVIKPAGAKKVFVGNNFHFGRGKKGNVDAFRKIGKRCGIDVREVASVRHNGRVVSSTWLRELISRGEIGEAEKLLKRPVSILGTVVKGDSRGRVLGFPTANVDPHHEVSPPPGVYAAKIDAGKKIYDGVVNIGFRPTFYGRLTHKRREPRIEVHIFGFSGRLYGRTIEVFFIKKLRNEKKFQTEKALIARIRRDAASAKKLLSNPSLLYRIKRYKGD